MRSSAKNSFRLLALCAAAAGSVWVGIWAADQLELRSARAVEAALAEAGYPWATIESDGLVVRIGGEAPDEATRFRVIAAAGMVQNPANLRDEMSVSTEATAEPPQFSLELLRRGSDLTVHGLIPARTPGRSSLGEQISLLNPTLDLADLLTISRAPAPDNWQETVAVGLAGMAALDNSHVRITPGELQIEGLGETETQALDLERKLRLLVPEDVSLALNLQLPRPVVSPFIARFRIDEAGGKIEVCSAKTETGRDQIEAAAIAAGIDAAGQCALAVGAPHPDWDNVLVASLETLVSLGGGTLSISDLNVTLTPREAPLAADLTEARNNLEQALPDLFRLEIPVTGIVSSGASSTMEFVAVQDRDDQVVLVGPLPSQESITIVESLARSLFDQSNLTMTLRQRAGLPNGWTIRVLSALDAFANVSDGNLTVSPDMIALTGNTGSKTIQPEIAASLSASLGAEVKFNLKITYKEELDPLAALPTPEECIGKITEIQTGTKITFAPGETELDVESLGIVRKIADVLQDCPKVSIEIGGHTDSQGRDEMNETLSQARADAVLSALIGERVLTSGMTAKGYGETQPVSDNGNAEGREANRRIEFTLVAPEPTPEDEEDSPNQADADSASPEEPPNGPE